MDINEKLIELVRKNKCLYDFQDKYYRNTTYKLRLWEKIALELNMTSAAVKTKWKILRDGYIKHKKQVQGNTGSERKNISYIWAEQLSFLEDTTKPRSTTTNITATIKQPLQPSFSETSLEEFEMTEQTLVSDLPMDSYPTSTDVEFSLPLAADAPISLPPGTYVPSTPLTRGATISSPIPSPTSTYTPSSATPLMTTTQYPKRKQNESDIDKAINYLRNKKKAVYDGTDHLFLSYASNLKKLSIPKQAELKVKLAQLFAEAEVSEFLNQENSATQVQQYVSPAYSIISQNSEHEEAAGTSGENSGLQHLSQDN